MKIHRCYFCNYQTRQRTHFINHVTKKNKCNYLIASATINSIEDYYNLVELHRNAPNNVIFGVNLDDSPPKFYESDENENLPCENIEELDKNEKYVEDIIQNTLNKTLICIHCNKEFTRKDSLVKHLNGRCKVLKKIKKEEAEQKEEEAQYQETLKSVENTKLEEQVMLMKKLMEKQMEKQKKEMEEKFKKEIQELKKNNNQITNNTNNNTNNNTTNIEEQNNIENNIETNIENNIEKVENNFIINNFGYENTDIFDEEERMISYIRKPFNALPNMIEKLHFTPSKRPENTNIRINNISNGKSQIYKYKWVTIMKHDLIFDLFKINAERLIYTYETYLEEGKIERLSWIEKFRYQFENDDKYFYKTQQEKIDCKLVDCMKKNKSYMNCLE